MTSPKALERRRKYGNKPVSIDGVRFDSGREARRWSELQLLERGRVIADLQRQVPFVLAASVRFDGEKRAKPALKYVADFFYHEKGQRVVEDVKSPATARTAAYRIKKHLLKALYGIEIREVK